MGTSLVFEPSEAVLLHSIDISWAQMERVLSFCQLRAQDEHSAELGFCSPQNMAAGSLCLPVKYHGATWLDA